MLNTILNNLGNIAVAECIGIILVCCAINYVRQNGWNVSYNDNAESTKPKKYY